jgi:hypothetical protein
MPLYTCFYTILLNVLVQIANKMGLQKNIDLHGLLHVKLYFSLCICTPESVGAVTNDRHLNLQHRYFLNIITDTGFQPVTAMDTTAFRDVAPNILIEAYRRFGGMYHVNLEGRRVGHASHRKRL